MHAEQGKVAFFILAIPMLRTITKGSILHDNQIFVPKTYNML